MWFIMCFDVRNWISKTFWRVKGISVLIFYWLIFFDDGSCIINYKALLTRSYAPRVVPADRWPQKKGNKDPNNRQKKFTNLELKIDFWSPQNYWSHSRVIPYKWHFVCTSKFSFYSVFYFHLTNSERFYENFYTILNMSNKKNNKWKWKNKNRTKKKPIWIWHL